MDTFNRYAIGSTYSLSMNKCTLLYLIMLCTLICWSLDKHDHFIYLFISHSSPPSMVLPTEVDHIA